MPSLTSQFWGLRALPVFTILNRAVQYSKGSIIGVLIRHIMGIVSCRCDCLWRTNVVLIRHVEKGRISTKHQILLACETTSALFERGDTVATVA